MNESQLLVLEDITKFYNSKLILRRVSLELKAHSLGLVTGANGAGKSTLLRIMAGLSMPDSGNVHYLQQARAYLGHATCVYAGLTALENLRFWAKTFGIEPTEMQLMDLLTRYDLGSHAHEQARNFSRGMAQKLNFCRILLINAPLAILDEPFTGLDEQSRKLMKEDILFLKNAGCAIVMTGHNFEEDSALADEVFFINNHKLAFSGKPAEFLNFKQAGELM